VIKRIPTSYIYLILSVLLAVLLKFWEQGLGFSSSSYGALARSILLHHNWFRPTLGPDLFDPFVDHPYLVLWLDALVFKVLGASAQTVRLVGSFSGLAVFTALFFTVRQQFNERAAFLSCLCLLALNEFMNFMSSGWLDMPMIAMVWIGFWFANLALKQQGDRRWSVLSGAFLAAAVLAKGFGALAVIPIFFWFLFESRTQPRKIILFSVGIFLPLAVFSWAHYQSEGFFFWWRYFERQVLVQNHADQQVSGLWPLLWYPLSLLKMGHVFFLLGIWATVRLFRLGHKSLAVLIFSQLFLHTLIYTFSSRHYNQYVLPVFPWFMLAAGTALDHLIPQRWNVEAWPKYLLRFAVVAFVVLDLIPFRIHHGNEHPFRGFQRSLRDLKDSGHVYFWGQLDQQWTWEDMASDIPWYWERVPHIADSATIIKQLVEIDPKALGVWPIGMFKKDVEPFLPPSTPLKVCLWNETYVVVTHVDLCPASFQGYRPAQSRKQAFIP